MSNETRDMLTTHVDSVLDAVHKYAAQIDSGVFGRNLWAVYNDDEDDGNLGDVLWGGYADDEDDAYRAYVENNPIYLPRDLVDIQESDNEYDEPTIVDDESEAPITEWPLEVVVKIGRPLAVVVTTGGPHIELVHDLGDGSAKLVGYWGGETITSHHSDVQTVLDYLTENVYDSAPEEWK